MKSPSRNRKVVAVGQYCVHSPQEWTYLMKSASELKQEAYPKDSTLKALNCMTQSENSVYYIDKGVVDLEIHFHNEYPGYAHSIYYFFFFCKVYI